MLERRLKVMRLSEECHLAFFQPHQMDEQGRCCVPVLTSPLLPPGCSVERVDHSFSDRCWHVMVSHPSFPEVADGAYIPVEPAEAFSLRAEYKPLAEERLIPAEEGDALMDFFKGKS